MGAPSSPAQTHYWSHHEEGQDQVGAAEVAQSLVGQGLPHHWLYLERPYEVQLSPIPKAVLVHGEEVLVLTLDWKMGCAVAAL